MSFTTNKAADGATPPAVILRPAGRASAPISRAQLVRSVRLHPWLALSVGCVVAGGLAGYALSGWAPDLAGPVPLPVALLVAALPLGLLCGLLAAILRHRHDAKIYGAADIDELIGLPPLAILPARGEVASGAYEAHLLRLAGAIAGANRSRGAKAFLLTAVSEGTRIEPLVSALRRKFEETGFRLGVVSAADLLRPAEEVSSRGFVAANLARLTVDDRLLLVEAEPLLHSAETEFVAHCVDATILVVECAVTTRQELWRAAAELERMQVSGVAAVLEELPMAFAGAHYRATVEAAETATSFRKTSERTFAAASDLVSERAPEAVSEAVSEPVAARAPVEQVQPAVVVGPVLVSGAVESPGRTLEKAEDRPRNGAVDEIPREKIAAARTMRPQASASDGESGMKPRIGWLGRLFGRDSEPASIVPAYDGEDETSAVSAEARAEEDYSAPLATRLDQISRQRPAAPASAGRGSRRLQIVPQEAPREIFVPSTRVQEAERPAESGSPQLSGPEYPSVAALGAATTFADAAIPAPAAPRTAESRSAEPAEELAEPVTLSEPAPEPVTFGTAHFEPKHFDMEAFETAPDPMQEQFLDAGGAPGRLNDLLSQQEREWETGQAIEPEPLHSGQNEPETALAGTGHEEVADRAAEAESVDAAEEDRAPQSGPHTGYEVLAYVPEVKTPSEVAWRTYWQEPAHLAGPAHLAEEPLPADQVLATAQAAAPEPEAGLAAAGAEDYPAQYDADDIEPVYEEVSRHLTSSRWDPIPTLRPDSNGWRDRPSPMPPSDHGVERTRWTGEDQDLEAWRSGPSSGSGPRMDSLPEPLLTRQWGLLSKFQQSRLSSGSRPAARTEEDETVSNGNGKH